MSLLSWDDELSVEVKEIDDQHKKLIEQLNKLNEAMREGKGKEVAEDILSELVKYTDYHFRTEEKYMKRFDYDGYGEHKRAHENFVEEVTEFQEKFEEGSVGLTVKMMNFLKNWVTEHIDGLDQKYVECFKENNLS